MSSNSGGIGGSPTTVNASVPTEAAGTPNTAGAVYAQIQSVAGSLTSLANELNKLIADLSALAERKPQAPKAPSQPRGTKGSESAWAGYDAAAAKYAGELQAWQEKMLDLKGKIDAKTSEIGEKTTELDYLQNVKLPSFQQRDREEMQKQIEAARKAPEQALEAKGESSAYEEVVRIEEQRRRKLKGPASTPGTGIPLVG